MDTKNTGKNVLQTATRFAGQPSAADPQVTVGGSSERLRGSGSDRESGADVPHSRERLMTDRNKFVLTPVSQKFILHWGEMGTRWGINRTVAQVHALLFLSPHPLPADEIATTLAVARSNISTSLRELQGWGIARVVHVLGDRRDHFESTKDVVEIFRIVSEERKRREIDPTLRVISECVSELKATPQGDVYTRERLESMLEFLTGMTGLFEEVVRMPTGVLKGAMKMRGKVVTLLGQRKSAAG
jgi:DNA-binding transcriptional regulator GbsR (MarR family)